MSRPPKQRNVQSAPEVVVYKPAGVPARLLRWVTLTLDEFETIRQVDYEGLEQEAVAASMGVSRPTVSRIYGSARKKIADVLVHGQALKIEGGPVVNLPQPGPCRFGYGRGRGLGRGRRFRGGRGQNEF